MKINRRDYLLRMGASTAGFLAAAELPVFGRTSEVRAPRDLRWTITHTPPVRDAFVTAIYCGLVNFTYHNDRYVDVLFNRGKGNHKLEIQIYENPNYPRRCPLVETFRPRRTDRLKLAVDGQSGGNPEVFQVDTNPFNRNNTDSTYADDFRWLPDLHSDDFYPDGPPLKPVRSTRLEVHTGTFYTRTRSTSTFSLIHAANPNHELRDFGHMALYMATAITAQRNVVLKRNDEVRPLYTFRTGNKYQIVFRNECESNCLTPEPHSNNEERRNDFHFNRKLLDLPAGKPQYGLKIKVQCKKGVDCATHDFCIQRPHRFSDEAPCSGSGYGKAPGFP